MSRARRCVVFAALVVLFSRPARSGELGLSSSNVVTIKPGTESALFQLSADNEPVLAVKPDGTVLVRGVAVEKMNTEEAKEAWREVTLWVAQQYQHTNINSYLSKQTDYLLQQLEECQRRCRK